MNFINSHNIAYLAGLIDGEGSFSIQVDIQYHKKRPNVRINPRITMTIRDGNKVLDELKQTFGGQIYSYPSGCRRWNLSKKQLILNATEELLPYLRIKKQIAEQFIEAVKLIPATKQFKQKGERTLSQETAIKIAEVALSLNPETSRKTKELLYTKLEKIKMVYEI